MTQLLKIGQTIHTETSKQICTVEQFLGGGAQGEVYQIDYKGHSMALKWYFSHYLRQDGRLRVRLQKAIALGPPTAQFLWPLELASAPDLSGFGYIMPLREPRFKSIVDLMKRRAEPSFHTIATIGFELAHNYFELHAKGLCYRDINFGNAFFDPDTGEVRICDNDNVDVNGQPGPIAGAPRFMAPEIVRGEAFPTRQTDWFSLAVLLFYICMVHHPLEGKKEADIHALNFQAMRKLYGKEPVFIFDPNDDSNRPVPGYHDNAIVFWPLYPQFLRKLFTDAFTIGIQDPGQGRVTETVWREAMTRLRDSIVYCTACKAENFYDIEGSGTKQSVKICWSCGKTIPLPWQIHLKYKSINNVVILNHGTTLFHHHIDDPTSFNFSKRMAMVTQHPQSPNIWGLTNLSDTKWVSFTADSKVIDVFPGRSVKLAPGTKINFGKTEGEIRQ